MPLVLHHAPSGPLRWRIAIEAPYVRQTTRYDRLELPGCQFRTRAEALPTWRALRALDGRLTWIPWDQHPDLWTDDEREQVWAIVAPLVAAREAVVVAVHTRQQQGRAF